MRSLLLFIGSCLYPAIMVIISPLLMFTYFLLALVLLSRYLRVKSHRFVAYAQMFMQQFLHLTYKKQHLSFRPKAVRLH